MTYEPDPLVERVIGCAIEVHRFLGPGLLESTYERCLIEEFIEAGICFDRQVPIPVAYKRARLDCGYRVDFIVENELLIEIKSVESTLPIHVAQVITYVRLAGLRRGLLMNFNVNLMRNGVRSVLLRPRPEPEL
jgi:GxxExxY protein